MGGGGWWWWVVSSGGGLWCLRVRVRVRARFPGRMDWTIGHERRWTTSSQTRGGVRGREGREEEQEDKGEGGAQVEDGDAETPR